jgi:2-dehydropantoate 2-reductase
MKILIMGTGGIGGYYGARLAQAGGDVFFVARGAHLEAMKEKGLRVTSVAGDFHLPGVQASSNPQDAGPIDIVILGTKTWDIETAMMAVKPVLKNEGLLLHFQNGIDIADRISKFLKPAQIIGGVEYGVVQIANPGHIDHSTQIHQLIYGAFGGQNPPLLQNFHELAKKSKFEAHLVNDIEIRLWAKFLFICAYSGVTSLVRLPIGPVMKDPDTRALFESCMREIEAVAKAKGVRLPANTVDERLEFSAKKLEPTASSSMQRDLEAGRPLEVEALNGTLSKMAKKLGVPTPVNDFIYTALKLHASGHARPSRA